MKTLGNGVTTNGTDTYTYDNQDRLSTINYDKLYNSTYKGDKINKINYDRMGNRTALENYRLKERQEQTCTEDTVVEEYKLPNGKTKTRERKVTNCTPEVTVVEKQLNTLDFTTNELNQYTQIDNKNKNGEIKKEFSYKYDNNGNLKEDDINMYFYDYKNRLVKAVKKEIVVMDQSGAILSVIPEIEIVKYSYDTLGRRTKKIKADTTTTYIYAGENAIEEQTKTNDGTLKETRINIYSNKTDDILATYITNHTKNTTYKYFYEKDHLGSITKITDTIGNTVEEYEYDAFGAAYIRKDLPTQTNTGELETTLSLTEVEGSETDTTGEGEELTMNGIKYKRYNGKGLINNTRLYTGREYEKELKLYYNRARYYNPQLGRFISRDPIDISDDVNLYTYVGNNPVMFVDVMGLEKVLIMYSPNHWKDIFSKSTNNQEKTEILSNYYLSHGYNKENVNIVSINSAEDFINNINDSGIKKGKIIYVGHNQLWLSKNLTDENINKLNSIDNENVSMDLYACATIVGDDGDITWSNQIAQKLANQLKISISGSTTEVYEEKGIFYGNWENVSPGVEIKRVPSIMDYIILPAY